jgi:hypothetical protein
VDTSGFRSWQSYDEWLEEGPIVLELNRDVFKGEEIITSYDWLSLQELKAKKSVKETPESQVQEPMNIVHCTRN